MKKLLKKLLPKWQLGRQQDATYYKIPLYRFRLGRWGFDCYIIRYPGNTILPWHIDPVDGKHWRCNIKLKGTCYFGCRGDQIVSWGEFLHIFRADKRLHRVIAVSRTYKLSFGIAKFDKYVVDDISGREKGVANSKSSRH